VFDMPMHSQPLVDAAGQTGLAKELRTAAWYGDRAFSLPFPVEWQVTVLWPATPALSGELSIVNCLHEPAGQPPLSMLCRGKLRPLVIVDGPQWPTPVARILPHVLEQFREGGIAPASVRIIVATEAHSPPQFESLFRKLGPEAFACTVVVHKPHEHLADLGYIGGIRVTANRELIESDLIVGIEGLYLNSAGGFQSQSQLILGVLGLETTAALRSRYRSAEHAGEGESGFRRALDEIAERIGLRTTISGHIDAERQLVRLACGDRRLYYDRELAFARATYGAAPPEGADVVISNAYPSDLSCNAVEEHALAPLQRAPRDASRIVLASCPEGVGTEHLFPYHSFRPAHWWQAFRPSRSGDAGHAPASHRCPIWLYQPTGRVGGVELPESLEPISPTEQPIRVAESWRQILRSVRIEQQGKRFLRVCLYPCAPLQYLL
jgi:nickel-dependent lactate racemase